MTGGARKPKPGWLDSAVLSSPSLAPPGIHHYLLWSRLLFDSSRSSRSVTSCLFLCSLQEMHHFLPCRLDKSVCSQCVLLKSQLPQEMCFSFSRCQLLRSDFCANFPPFFSCCFLSCFQKALSTSIFCLLLQYKIFLINGISISVEDTKLIHCCVFSTCGAGTRNKQRFHATHKVRLELWN